MEYYKKNGEKVIVLDVPLLLELGLTYMVDEVWLVAVDGKTQLNRLMARENMDLKQAMDRIKSQMPLKEKLKLAHRVIDTSGNLDKT